MGGFISYNSFDHKVIDIVPVIASFDAQGHICPLYVRIARTSYKIESFFVSSKYSNVVEFRCKILDRDCLKPLELTFYGTENMWTIPKAGLQELLE